LFSALLDRFAQAVGITSRSAAIQRAIRLLPSPELDDAYAAAWDEWEASGDAAAWEETTADGLADASR
jgi:hypothetical protein